MGCGHESESRLPSTWTGMLLNAIKKPHHINTCLSLIFFMIICPSHFRRSFSNSRTVEQRWGRRKKRILPKLKTAQVFVIVVWRKEYWTYFVRVCEIKHVHNLNRQTWDCVTCVTSLPCHQLLPANFWMEGQATGVCCDIRNIARQSQTSLKIDGRTIKFPCSSFIRVVNCVL